MNPMARKSNETQREYRERLRAEKQSSKYRHVRVLWDSSTKGTYIRRRDGDLSA